MRHNRFIAVNFLVLERKNRKIANFLKGIKQQNRFIDSFLEEQRIGVALTDSFFLNRAHHCIWLTASLYMGEYLRISSYIRKPFLIYDFATAPF